MRLFIGISVDAAARKELCLAQKLLAGLGEGKLVPENNFHLTLRFLGECDRRMLGGAARALKESVRGIRPFELALCGIDSFAHSGVVFAALKAPRELFALYESLQSALFEEGFAQERKPLRPHITLARKMPLPPEAKAALDTFSFSAVFSASAVTLFESTRAGEHMRYTPLHTESF